MPTDISLNLKTIGLDTLTRSIQDLKSVLGSINTSATTGFSSSIKNETDKTITQNKLLKDTLDKSKKDTLRQIKEYKDNRILFRSMSTNLGTIAKTIGIPATALGATISAFNATTKGVKDLITQATAYRTLLGEEGYQKVKGLETAFGVYGVNTSQSESILGQWQYYKGQLQQTGKLPNEAVSSALARLNPQFLAELRDMKVTEFLPQLINAISKKSPASQSFYSKQLGLPLSLIQAQGLNTDIKNYTSQINDVDINSSLELKHQLAELSVNWLNLWNKIITKTANINSIIVGTLNTILKGEAPYTPSYILGFKPIQDLISKKVWDYTQGLFTDNSIEAPIKKAWSYGKELFNDNPTTSPTTNNVTPPSQYNITINTGDINGTSGEEIGEGLAKQLMHQENSSHNSIESGAVR